MGQLSNSQLQWDENTAYQFLHADQWEGQQWNISPGNIYSDVMNIRLDPSESKTIKLVCKNVIPPVKVPEDTKWVKRIKFESKILTKFWGQPIYLGATLLLPKDYDEHSDVFYPVCYWQGHFSLRAPNGFTTEEPGTNNPRRRTGYDFYKYWISDDCPRMILVTFQHPCPYYDDSHAIFCDKGTIYLLELIRYDTPILKAVSGIKKNSAIYYCDDTGNLYFIDSGSGKLTTIQLLAKQEILPQPFGKDETEIDHEKIEAD